MAVSLQPEAAPAVRLELRQGASRPVACDITGSEFLIGSVAGCDLRLSGPNLPPVLCVISRASDGVRLRKLAPTVPLAVNGTPVTTANLRSGDTIALGPIAILVLIDGGEVVYEPAPAPAGVRFQPIGAPSPAPRESDKTRDDLTTLRRELYKQYQERRDRLAGLQQAVQNAAKKLQERKRQFESELQQAAPRLREIEARRLEVERREREVAAAHEQVARAKLALDEEVSQFDDRRNEVVSRERAVAEREEQYRNDLTRLDRLGGTLEQRERQLEARQAELDRKTDQLRIDSEELEEQARQIDGTHVRQREQAQQLVQIRAELETRSAKLEERAAALETQQSTLAGLRTQMERMRDQVRAEATILVEQRARQDAAERAVQEKLQKAEALRTEVDSETLARSQTQKQLEERQAELQQAAAQLRDLQCALAAEAELQKNRAEEFDRKTAEQEQQAEELASRATQLVELQQRLETDRLVLKDREAALGQTDETRRSLQEQLRRRAEELAARSKELEAKLQAQEAAAGHVGRQSEALGQTQADAEAIVQAARDELSKRDAELQKRAEQLSEREEALRRHVAKLKDAGAALASERKAHFEARSRWTSEQQAIAAEAESLRNELDNYRSQTARESVDLRKQLPELELRGQTVLDRLSQAREQLRGHLAELHEYTRLSQDDLQNLRGQLQAETERLRQQEQSVQRARSEHRLAVTAFRQQLIDWQGRIADMRQVLARDGTRLEWKQAEIDAAAQQVDATSKLLAQQAADLSVQERQVVERRTEVERHLTDMREWYRGKLRELAETSGVGSRVSGSGNEDSPSSIPMTASDYSKPETRNPIPEVLQLADELDPGDRQLGDLLRSLELVDGDTLQALLMEARRQRRSLRQVLLSGRENGTPLLTLYQMALIEAGNLDGLVLGPMRVVDRLQVTARETVYRVFDPRRGGPVLLRHLAEAEMHDAVHPDEFRQRFGAAAAIDHPNVAATYELLEINGRPAASQEWLTGLPSNEWPAAAGVSGVWFRLVTQAALALQTAHHAGLVHGALTLRNAILTGDGVVKITGFGDPAWLAGADDEASAAGDILALGRLAAAWAALAPRRKNGKPVKAMPAMLQTILKCLQPESDDPYTSAEELLNDLERAGANLPDSAEAWTQLLDHVRTNGAEAATWRKSA